MIKYVETILRIRVKLKKVIEHVNNSIISILHICWLHHNFIILITELLSLPYCCCVSDQQINQLHHQMVVGFLYQAHSIPSFVILKVSYFQLWRLINSGYSPQYTSWINFLFLPFLMQKKTQNVSAPASSKISMTANSTSFLLRLKHIKTRVEHSTGAGRSNHEASSFGALRLRRSWRILYSSHLLANVA